jgi:hypothetical protein
MRMNPLYVFRRTKQPTPGAMDLAFVAGPGLPLQRMSNGIEAGQCPSPVGGQDHYWLAVPQSGFGGLISGGVVGTPLQSGDNNS